MPVQTRPQPLLVQVMRNQPDTPAQHEQSVEHAVPEVVFRLFCRESTAVPEKVDEADSHATVDVQDQVVLLRGCDGLDGNGVVKKLGGWEVLLAELFDEGDAEIGVVARLDAVANAGD